MADKPSRALVLYGDGLARFVDPSHTHLHSLASKAACGFLSLSNAPPSESEDKRIVREFAQLLDACEAYRNKSREHGTDVECQNKSFTPSLSERFMGMRAALVTNSSCLKSFGSKLGFTVFQVNELVKNIHLLSDLPVDVVASQLLKLLGFQEGKTLDASQFDLVIVHIGVGETLDGEKDDVEYINSLVGFLMHLAQPGSDISSRLHFSLVMSYGCVSEADNLSFSVLNSKDGRNSSLSMLFPRQSYTVKGEDPRTDVRHYCPMLMAQWQYAVTRMDMAETFSFKDFKENGVNMVIPADRFMHEVAFKLWKAPKYGA